MNILYRSLHNINMNQEDPIRKTIPADFNDYMEAYVEFATSENKISRAYRPVDANRTVLRCVSSIFSRVRQQGDAITETETIDLFANSIAHKLLDVEKAVQRRVGQMTDIQKGSIVQVLIKEQGSYKYVIAKVEHSEWFDGETLKKNLGFPGENKRVWKSVVFGLDMLDDTVDFIFIKVYVNHPAKYWSAEFLEVQEAKTDTVNTEAVLRGVNKCLRPIKTTSPRDYYNLKNTVLHELQSKHTINYPEMVQRLVDTYDPASNAVNMTDLKEKLLEAQRKEGFDSQFNSDPSAIKTKDKITLNISRSISVLIKEGVPNWKDEFLISKKPDGKSYLMIRCDDPTILSLFLEEENQTLVKV